MRTGLGIALFIFGCTSGDDHKLPGASITPHLDSQQQAAACGDDIAFWGNATPDLSYAFTYDAAGRMSHAEGVYVAGGANDEIDYTFDNLDRVTHMTQTRAWGDYHVEIGADYDTPGDLLDYTYDVTGANNYHDTWSYNFSNFTAAGQPTREVISEVGQPDIGYTLDFDANGRIVDAVMDNGPTTNYSYDDVARTLTIDTGNGAFHGVYVYDAQDRPISETWGGSDPQAYASDTEYSWTGDQLDSIVYQSGTYQNPQQLQLVETDTLRYSCATARTGTARTPRLIGRGPAPRRTGR